MMNRARRGPTEPAPPCRTASAASQPQTAALCLASFVLANDPATGSLAARALEAQDGAEDIIERRQSEGVPAGQWATFVVVGGLRAKP